MADGVFTDLHAKEIYISGSLLIVKGNKVGVNVSSPSVLFQVDLGTEEARFRRDAGQYLSLTSTATGNFISGIGSSKNLIVENQSNGAIIFETNNIEVARIDISGSLLIGTTAAASGVDNIIQIANSTNPLITANPTNSGILWVSGGILIYKGSSGTLTQLGAA